MFAVLASFISLAGSAFAVDPTPEAQCATHLEKLLRTSHAPAFSAAVALQGRIVFSEGVGFADLDNMVPATGSTVYNIGSISKANTAVAVMQLLEKGSISLDDTIQKYVPTFPDKGVPITIKNLMTHTSGIRHYRSTDFPDSPVNENTKRYASIQEAIAIFKDDPLLFRPGEEWQYSSYATNLLQGVIETASGMPFEAYMRQNVWGPAGMLSTAFDVPERIVPHRARSYRLESGRLLNYPYADLSYKFAGGGMISTAEDLVRLCVALNHGRLLKVSTATLMYHGYPEALPRHEENHLSRKPESRQGLLWGAETDNGRRVVRHDGSVRGFNACVANYPEEDVASAILYNAADGPPTCSEAQALAHFFLPPPGK